MSADRPAAAAELAGREIRALDVPARALDHDPALARLIEDLHQDRLDAAVLRQAFPEPLRRTIVARLEADPALPWRRPNRTGPAVDIQVLGAAATPTFETPGGPAVDGYFADAAQYTELYDRLLADGDAGAGDPIERLLARIAGGRPVARLVGADGRRFAACTIRALPEGQRIIVHNDHGHYQLPVYRGATDGLDTSTSLSFLVMLQAPEAGGELVIHGLTSTEPAPRLASGMPDGQAIQDRYRSHRCVLQSGDVLVFAAGRFYHHVAPVIGARPRITLGGFMTLDREHRRLMYWN